MKLPIRKKRSYLLSVLYKALFNPVTRPLGQKAKVEMFLYLSWVFERLAANSSYQLYSTPDHPGRKNTWELMEKHLKPGDSVLDMGCSRGYYANLIATRTRKVVGVDHNAASIEIARKTYQRANLEFHNTDAFEYLEKNGEKFDLLVLTHVLEHLEDPVEFLSRFKRFFQNVYIEVPDFENTILNQVRKDLGVPFIYSDEDHKWEFSHAELLEVVTKAGFRVLEEKRAWGIQTLYLQA